MVRGSLAVVSDKLESANDLANSEESEQFGGNNTTGGHLSSTDISGALDELLRRLENRAVLDGLEEVLVV